MPAHERSDRAIQEDLVDYNEDWLMEDQLDSIGNAPISGLNAMPFDPITADGSKSLCNAYFKNSLGTKG